MCMFGEFLASFTTCFNEKGKDFDNERNLAGI